MANHGGKYLDVNIVLNDEAQAIFVSMTPWKQPYPSCLILEARNKDLYIWDQDGKPIAMGPSSASIGLMQCKDFFLGDIVSEKIVTVAETAVKWRSESGR